VTANARIIAVSIGVISLVFGGCVVRADDPLDTWVEHYVGETVLRDVAFGADVFVAVGDAFYDSPDGVCWTRRPLGSPSMNGMSGVAYGNGRFVAVEAGGYLKESRVYISTNGAAWQQSATLPASYVPVIQRVDFGGGAFLAVGQEPNPSTAPGYHWLVMTSPDGITWSRHSGPTNSGESYSLNVSAYGNAVYLVGGLSRNPTQQGLVLISTNLATWLPVDGFPFSGINGLTYGKDQFVAVGSSIATSSDGVHWTNQSLGLLGQVLAVAFGANSFVAVGEPELILSSTDAINWAQHPTSVESLASVTYGNSDFVAVGGYYVGDPIGVAVQSGGRPQVVLHALGFSPSGDPGFRLLLCAERGRTYRLQAAPLFPAGLWTDVSSVFITPGYPDQMMVTDSNAPATGQRFYRVVSP